MTKECTCTTCSICMSLRHRGFQAIWTPPPPETRARSVVKMYPCNQRTKQNYYGISQLILLVKSTATNRHKGNKSHSSKTDLPQWARHWPRTCHYQTKHPLYPDHGLRLHSQKPFPSCFEGAAHRCRLSTSSQNHAL